MPETSNLGLPLMVDGQTQKALVYNTAMQILNTLAQPVALDIGEIVPPSTPAEGDVHIVGATDSTSGDWNGHDDQIAVYQGGAWAFITPKIGWRFYVVAGAADYRYTGASETPWEVIA